MTSPYGSGAYGSGPYGTQGAANMATNANLMMAGASGKLYLAPVGSTLPTTATAAPASPFADMGLISDSGVVEQNSTSWQKFKPWGYTRSAKQSLTDAELTQQVTFWQSTDVNILSLFYGLPTVPTVSTAGAFDFARPTTYAPVFRSLVLDVFDGPTRIHRTTCTKIQVTQLGNVSYTQAAIAEYQMTFDFQGDVHDYISDSAQATM